MEKLNNRTLYFFIRSLFAKKYLLILFIPVTFIVSGFFVSTAFAGVTNITEDITENTHWTVGNSPYLISTSITVTTGATLNIDPGVVVKFDGGAGLIVDGKIEAEGTKTTPIYFTSLYDDVGGDTNGDGEDTTPVDGDWDCLLIESPEQSILNNVIERYSSDGLILYNGGSVSSNSYNSDQGIITFGSNSTFVNLAIQHIELYDASTISIEHAIISSDDNINPITIEGKSSLNLKNSEISGQGGYMISIYDNSSAIFDTDEISEISPNGTAIGVWGGSSLEISKGNVKNSYNGFEIFQNSNLTAKDLSLECDHDGIDVFVNSVLNLSGGNISCLNDGLALFSDTKANINGVKITDALDAGITAFSNTDINPITVTKSEITDNNYGFLIFDSAILAQQNSIHDNLTNGALTYPYDPPPTNLDFTNNWWGDKSGPTNSLNSDGIGDTVSDGISFTPFLKSDPLKPTKNPVILIPGVTGTYLIKDYGDKTEIWPNILNALISPFDNYLRDLELLPNGNTNLDFPMKIGDIIRGVSLPLVSDIHIFDNLILELENNGGYVEGENLFVFPYDWRLSNTKNAELLKDKIDEILYSTGAGKVDIVAHSMGGLVTKRYIAGNGEDKIDKLIFLGTPQLGAPKALKTLMFGDDMGIGIFVFGLNSNTVKTISQNMPSIYELLPSEKYIKDNGSYVTNALNTNISPISLNYNQTENFMINNGRNIDMFPFARNLHDSIDNLDLSGINAYNFVGCGGKTIGQIIAKQELSWTSSGFNFSNDFDLNYVNGDETVPLESANKTIGANLYFVDGTSHGALPSAEGVKQDILSILKGETLSNFPNILADSSACNIPGKVVSTHSPVELHIYDDTLNHTGPTADGEIENNIPGVQYDIIDGAKFAFLPDGVNYKIVTKATDTGGYNFQIKDIDKNDKITATYDWTLIPLETLKAKGEISVGPNYPESKYKVTMDNNGDNIPDTTVSSNLPADFKFYINILRKAIDSLNLDAKIKKDILNKIDKIEKKYEKGKDAKVVEKLTKLLQKISNNKGKLKNISKAEKDVIVNSINVLLEILI